MLIRSCLVFIETPDLSADSIVYLTSRKRDWLGGRYINCKSDLPELMDKKDEVVNEDKLEADLFIRFEDLEERKM